MYARDKIMHIFRDLGSEELLRKCLHGTTQNNNEALNGVIWQKCPKEVLNGVIWQKCPKEVYVDRITLEMGVCSDIINFNSGSQAIGIEKF